jgi:hypothetical protein
MAAQEEPMKKKHVSSHLHPVAPQRDRATVSQKHKEQLALAQARFAEAQRRLGEADMLVAQYETARAHARQLLAQYGVEREQAVRNAAAAMDLDLNAENWTYQFEEGAFLRGQAVGAQAAPPPPAPPLPEAPDGEHRSNGQASA